MTFILAHRFHRKIVDPTASDEKPFLD